jgi:hypothetical protein
MSDIVLATSIAPATLDSGFRRKDVKAGADF